MRWNPPTRHPLTGQLAAVATLAALLACLHGALLPSPARASREGEMLKSPVFYVPLLAAAGAAITGMIILVTHEPDDTAQPLRPRREDCDCTGAAAGEKAVRLRARAAEMSEPGVSRTFAVGELVAAGALYTGVGVPLRPKDRTFELAIRMASIPLAVHGGYALLQHDRVTSARVKAARMEGCAQLSYGITPTAGGFAASIRGRF